MPITPAIGDTTARTVDEQFFDLVCSDADLLAVEFDAIVATEWPDPPANRFGRGTARGNPVSPAARRMTAHINDAVGRPRHPGVGGWARQRSPPGRDNPAENTKGR